MKARTLFDKIWDSHVIRRLDDSTWLVYVDRHLLHEGNTPHAFAGLKEQGRPVRRPGLTLGTVDHVVPTSQKIFPIADAQAQAMISTFEANCSANGIESFTIGDPRQGIVHVIGPERGFTLPGITLVCGDSHTCTHGAFGGWAFGIGISDVEHVLATQTLVVQRPRNMLIEFTGKLAKGVTAKDMALALTGAIGTAGATGHVIHYSGEAISALSMEGRMTVCNMACEAGARGGLVAPDDKTFAYLKGRANVPTGADWDAAVASWKELASDEGAHFDSRIRIDVNTMSPQVTWGTSPEDVGPITGVVPHPSTLKGADKQAAAERSLAYMGLKAGQPLEEIQVDRVFIGSCTNSRIEDLRDAADVVRGRRVASTVNAWVVPGSAQVKRQAEIEGLDTVFTDAGFQWRNPGCSMCMALNGDRLSPGERCASTSNRNFEGRQGRAGRTHLMSPAMAAAAAITGHLVDVRNLSL